MNLQAVIFDLDGTLIDNNNYHIKAWEKFYDKIGKAFDLDEYKNKINGKINRDIFKYIFNDELDAETIESYSDEKEALYRQLYTPYIEPIKGLIDFLRQLEDAHVPKAIATSGLPRNIDFMFEHVPAKEYFLHIIDSTQVQQGKPHPEIFLKAAAAVNADPAYCVAFEDSVVGITSAKAAGMKVVGLTTTHTADDIAIADKIIKDYTEISLQGIEALLNK